ncbi:MAG: hypothetical protein NTY76_01320 [Candidatus Omnitrophica bacterium]|nr:hypothetical protein [Candidatus Omnitrophota bacterium]
MRYEKLAVAIMLIGMPVLAYAADSGQTEKDGFVSSAISDVFDKVDKVTSGEKPILESVNDYDMDSSGHKIPKRRSDKYKKSALEEKLGE